ncbi:IS200/IS605 family transposase [Pinibacter soli]|uniref:IS200/IS605 family transposase n=1 Tax=Pinibacter soli TaxID=3044211 RepID=A0ABT6RD43_9BACT|nr:IS200/IS605 family transposase [Pinibacter soli]MDI3320498.1 IS200/IS605 family transposase [Pinibacter soli]
MANTYTQIYIQIVFAVKGRKCFIKEEFREEVQKYMAGIIGNKKQKLFAVYCMPDHVHMLVSIKPDVSLSTLVKDIKVNTTIYLKQQGFVNGGFSWQEGFGAFSYSKSQTPQVVSYILNQKEHHKRKTFREEYIEFLEKFGVEYSDKYLFEFYE